MPSITNHQGNANQNHRNILSYTCQNSYYQKDDNLLLFFWQVLERIWENRENSSTVEEMYFGVASMGRTTVWIILKKLKIGLLYNSAILILDICLKKMKTLIKKGYTSLHSLKHYLQKLRYESNVSIHQQMNG